MSKHTPGPWRVLPDFDRNRDSVRIFAGSKFIGMIGNSDDTHEQTYSNAALVAAAPELLDALEMLLLIDEEHAKCCEKAFAAIRKARGE